MREFQIVARRLERLPDDPSDGVCRLGTPVNLHLTPLRRLPGHLTCRRCRLPPSSRVVQDILRQAMTCRHQPPRSSASAQSPSRQLQRAPHRSLNTTNGGPSFATTGISDRRRKNERPTGGPFPPVGRPWISLPGLSTGRPYSVLMNCAISFTVAPPHLASEPVADAAPDDVRLVVLEGPDSQEHVMRCT